MSWTLLRMAVRDEAKFRDVVRRWSASRKKDKRQSIVEAPVVGHLIRWAMSLMIYTDST